MEQDNLYFHLSYDKDLTRLTPRVPNEYIMDYEDDITPRISASPTIEQCLTAMSDDSYMFYVYVIDITGVRTHKPTILDVPDVEYTEEIWIMEEVEPYLIGEVKVGRGKHLADVDLDKPYYDEGQPETNENYVSLFEYDYKFISYI